MKRFLSAPLLLLALVLSVPTAFASHKDPPAPPAVSSCGPCGGPPPPPTLVPTAPPGALPQATILVSVSARVVPSQVRPGDTLKLLVSSDPDAPLTVVFRYHHAKPFTVDGTTDGNGNWRHTWKVPRWAALGSATATVTVKRSPKPYVAVVQFDVVK